MLYHYTLKRKSAWPAGLTDRRPRDSVSQEAETASMARACGCEYEPAAWTAQVESACRKQGVQLTPLRRRVLDILSAGGAPLGAYAILEEMSRREGKRVAPPTVYRTLDFFLEHGFVHKIESLNAFAPCEHLEHAHHGTLLICEACGRSEEVEDAS